MRRRWRHGIKVGVSSFEHQDEIQELIFGELVRNVISDRSRERLLEIIRGYNPDGVILGCTKLPLLLQPQHTSVSLLDTLALHADAARDYTIGGQTMSRLAAITQNGGADR